MGSDKIVIVGGTGIGKIAARQLAEEGIASTTISSEEAEARYKYNFGSEAFDTPIDLTMTENSHCSKFQSGKEKRNERRKLNQKKSKQNKKWKY